MIICILIPTLQKGGAERDATVLANYLTEKGNFVKIITFDNDSPSYPLKRAVKLDNIYLGPNRSIRNIFKRVLLLRSKIKKIQPDIILSYFMKTTLYAILAKTNKMKIIGLERTNPFYVRKSKIHKLFEKTLLSKADGYIFLTKEAKYYYTRKIQKKSIIIPNGIFAKGLNNSVTPYQERKLNEIVAVGRLHPVKDYTTMIKAFEIFNRENKNYKLKIFGEGPEYSKLLQLVKELKLENKVIFMGNVEDLTKHTLDSGMYILSSRSESWCNALMESLALGIPCIATDCDFGPRSMIEHGVNGLLVPVGDSIKMAKAISKIANNPKLGNMLSENAIKIRENYKVEKIFNRYLDYINRVLNN